MAAADRKLVVRTNRLLARLGKAQAVRSQKGGYRLVDTRTEAVVHPALNLVQFAAEVGADIPYARQRRGPRPRLPLENKSRAYEEGLEDAREDYSNAALEIMEDAIDYQVLIRKIDASGRRVLEDLWARVRFEYEHRVGPWQRS